MTESTTKGRKTRKGHISAPLHAVIIEPASNGGEQTNAKAIAEVMKQIKELIRKDGRNNVRNLREGIDGRASETRVQPKGTNIPMP